MYKYCVPAKQGTVLTMYPTVPVLLATPVLPTVLVLLATPVLPIPSYGTTYRGEDKDKGGTRWMMRTAGQISNKIQEENLIPAWLDI